MKEVVRSLFPALVLSGTLLSAWSSPATAASYYTVYIRAEERSPAIPSYESFETEFHGYAWLDLANPSNIRGRLCLIGVEPFDLSGVRQDDGSLSMQVGTLPDRAILGPDDGYFELLEDLDIPVIDLDLDSDFTFNLGDSQFDPIEFDLKEIPVDALRAYRGELGSLANVSREEAFARLRNEDNRNIFAGQAIVIADAARRSEWEPALADAPAMLPEKNGVDSACEPPILIEEIEVPPIVEDWAAQRLMASNTVIFAAPIEQQGGPEGFTDEVESGPLYDLWMSAKSTEALDNVLERTFQESLLDYARRRSPPQSQVRVTVERDLSTFDLVFKFDILGWALNVCNRWERFTLDIRFAPRFTRSGQVGIELILIEPQFSPGQELRGDARFDENRMSPNDEGMLKDDLFDFMDVTDFGFALERANSRDLTCNTL